jgi:hypothetical protein
MVHCHLVYGNQIWGCANGSLITELYRKQKAAVRIISSSTYRAHTEPNFTVKYIATSLSNRILQITIYATFHPRPLAAIF